MGSSRLSHLLGFLYVIVAGYQLLVNEYSQGKYSFYYYQSPYGHSSSSILYILPFSFWGITICFGLLFFICRIERDIKLLLRQTILSGLIVCLFNLLLTLQSDTQYGSFIWPTQNIEFPFKSEYAQSIILISFFVFYIYIFKCVTKGSPNIGHFVISLFYLPTLPFVYQIFPYVHFVLLLCVGLAFYFFYGAQLDLNSAKKILINSRPVYSVVFVFIVGCVFRLWTLDYFSMLGAHNIPGLAADGPMYYKNAIGFLAGKTIGDMLTTPAYSYLLSVFFYVIGFDLVKVLTLQGILCALIPVFIFFIVKRIVNYKVALIASICTALSCQLILYSVVIQRAGMAAFFLAAGIFLLTKLVDKTRLDLTLIFGFCLGWVFLLDTILLPALMVLLFFFIFMVWKSKTTGKYLIVICLGIFLAELSFNWVIYKNKGTVYLLGVQTTKGSYWNQASIEEGTRLKELGFDPFFSITESFALLVNNPLKVGGLYLKKSYKEIQGYFFDHESFYLDPVLMNRETFFSSALSVYYFLVLLVGGLLFFLSKKVGWQYKFIVGVPVIYSILIQTFYLHGHARYRAVVQPLILILFAYGLYEIFQYLVQRQPNSATIRLYGEQRLDKNFGEFSTKRRNSNRLGFGVVLVFTFLLIFYQVKTLNQPPYFKNKKIVKLMNYFPWKDRENKPATMILSAPDMELERRFYVKATGSYHIAIKFAKEFGPSIYKFNFKFYLNDVLLREERISNRPGWIFLENLRIKTGHQRFVIKAEKKNESSLEKLGEFPQIRNISLMSFMVVES